MVVMETTVASVVVNSLAVMGTLLVMVVAVAMTKGMRAPVARAMVNSTVNMDMAGPKDNMEARTPQPKVDLTENMEAHTSVQAEVDSMAVMKELKVIWGDPEENREIEEHEAPQTKEK